MRNKIAKITALVMSAGMAFPWAGISALAEEAGADDGVIGTIAFAQCDEYINIRSEAGTDSEITGKIYNHCAATIVGKEGDWYKITSGNASGYVSAEYFATGEEAESIADQVAYNVAKVHPEVLMVRTGPDETTDVLCTAEQAEELEVVDWNGDWMKVAVSSDTYGYVNAYYVDYKTYYPVAETLEEEQNRLAELALSRQTQTEQTAETEQQAAASYTEEPQTEPEYTEPEYTETEPEYAEPGYAETEPIYTEPEYTETEPIYTEPEYTETEPIYTEPEYTETEPEYTEPEYTETEPGYTEPEYTETESGYTEPEYTETEPEYTEPEYMETEPEYTEPEYTETEPGYTEPEYTETEPGYTEPEYTETEPEYTEPEYTETEPEYTEPEYTETEAPAEPEYTDPGTSDRGQQIADYAVQFVGNPYVYGGTSLTNGADCSGFTQSVMAYFGIYLSRTADAQAGGGTAVDLGSIQPGDLLFYSSGGYIGHVALYIGGGQIVHASTEESGITISNYDYQTPYCARRYW